MLSLQLAELNAKQNLENESTIINCQGGVSFAKKEL